MCAWNSPVPGEVPAQRPVTRNFDVFFDLHPNKLLNKQSRGWRFEPPERPSWRHCNGKKSGAVQLAGAVRIHLMIVSTELNGTVTEITYLNMKPVPVMLSLLWSNTKFDIKNSKSSYQIETTVCIWRKNTACPVCVKLHCSWNDNKLRTTKCFPFDYEIHPKFR